MALPSNHTGAQLHAECGPARESRGSPSRLHLMVGAFFVEEHNSWGGGGGGSKDARATRRVRTYTFFNHPDVGDLFLELFIERPGEEVWCCADAPEKIFEKT